MNYHIAAAVSDSQVKVIDWEVNRAEHIDVIYRPGEPPPYVQNTEGCTVISSF